MPSTGAPDSGVSPGNVWFSGNLGASGGKMEKAGSGWLAGSTPPGTGMGVRVPSPRGLCSVTWAAR